MDKNYLYVTDLNGFVSRYEILKEERFWYKIKYGKHKFNVIKNTMQLKGSRSVFKFCIETPEIKSKWEFQHTLIEYQKKLGALQYVTNKKIIDLILNIKLEN